MGRLDGKVALITGAGRGQGRAHALRLAQEGCDVVVIDAPSAVATAEYAMSSKEDLERTVGAVEQLDRRAVAVEADVRSLADMTAAVERGIAELGKIDFLVANAGIWGQLALIQDMTEEAWQETVDINLTGVWRSVKAVAGHMIDRGEGAMVLLWLLSDEASEITGLEVPVDAGHMVLPHFNPAPVE